MMDKPLDSLLTQKDLSQYLGISDRALRYRSAKGCSMPKHVLIGSALRYRKKDVEAWLDQLQTDEEERQRKEKEHQDSITEPIPHGNEKAPR